MRTGPAGRRVTNSRGRGTPGADQIQPVVTAQPGEHQHRLLPGESGADPGWPHHLPCGCERTAGTTAAAIASEATAQAAPTVKARAKSWLPG